MNKITSQKTLLKKIKCKTCFLVFFLCRRCYRGHCYCSDQCRIKRQKELRRKFQSQYRTSDKGREANKNAAKKRRIKQKEKSVADQGSPPIPGCDTLPNIPEKKQVKCLLCGVLGRVVKHFPRRRYRSTSSLTRKLPRSTESLGFL